VDARPVQFPVDRLNALSEPLLDLSAEQMTREQECQRRAGAGADVHIDGPGNCAEEAPPATVRTAAPGRASAV